MAAQESWFHALAWTNSYDQFRREAIALYPSTRRGISEHSKRRHV